jgi:hypothetical protein
LLTILAEHWLDEEGPFATSSPWLAGLPLLLWLPIAPLLGVLVVGLAAFEAVRRTRRGSALLAHHAMPWLARGALAIVFLAAMLDLAHDAVILA